MAIGDLSHRDRQVANKEGQENSQNHLGDPPLVPSGLGVPVVLDGASFVGAVVEGSCPAVLSSLVLAHSLL